MATLDDLAAKFGLSHVEQIDMFFEFNESTPANPEEE
jgi:hypothetical protein